MNNPPLRPFTIVLTGGIASGKTAVSNEFDKLGIAVVDTDTIAREVVEPGQPALDAISDAFGKSIFMPDGTLDRKKLRRIIFSNPKSKKGLELILHPAIEIEVHKRLRLVESPYCILVIPLFAESDSYEWVDRVLLVDVPENVQLQRVMARDGVSLDDAKAILAAQANREERLAIADDVIENTGSLDELKARVRQLHEVYLELSEGYEVSG